MMGQQVWTFIERRIFVFKTFTLLLEKFLCNSIRLDTHKSWISFCLQIKGIQGAYMMPMLFFRIIEMFQIYKWNSSANFVSWFLVHLLATSSPSCASYFNTVNILCYIWSATTATVSSGTAATDATATTATAPPARATAME